MSDPTNPELESLLATRENLLASIDAREKQQASQPDGFRRVTDGERARVREIEARIEALSPGALKPAAKPTSKS